MPASVHVVRAFLGLADYYRHFIKDCGTITTPLTKLQHKGCFHWAPEVEVAFQTLQKVLTLASVLMLLAFDEDFIVECDASGSSIGAMLHQGHGTVAFFSRPIAPRHANLVAYERELIRLIQAFQH
jgi:hypothetical protein